MAGDRKSRGPLKQASPGQGQERGTGAVGATNQVSAQSGGDSERSEAALGGGGGFPSQLGSRPEGEITSLRIRAAQ